MDRLCRIIARHPIVVCFTIFIFIVPVIAVMNPIVLFLVIAWTYVGVTEIRRYIKDKESKLIEEKDANC